MSTSLFSIPMEDMVIPSGQQFSNALNWVRDYFDAEAFTIQAPTVLAETTSIQVSQDNSNWGDLADSTGTAILGPQAANQCMVYNGSITSVQYVRLKASGNVGGTRTFKTAKSFRT